MALLINRQGAIFVELESKLGFVCMLGLTCGHQRRGVERGLFNHFDHKHRNIPNLYKRWTSSVIESTWWRLSKIDQTSHFK